MRQRKLPYDGDAAAKHLRKVDAVMRDIIKRAGPLAMLVRGTPYQSLLRAILYQQLAGAAAAAIERRFLDLFDGRVPEPAELLAISPEALRAVGLSRQKASYMHSLAEHSANGHLSHRALSRMSDDEAIAAATEVKGIGRWTAEMMLIFCLGRPDVLPVDDLGVRRAMMVAYRMRSLPDPKRVEKVAEPWRPYRSAGTWYLWRSTEETDSNL